MSEDPCALFGRQLAKLRRERGWSQEKLALESGLARNIALVNICRLAETLSFPPSRLLEFEAEAPG